MESPAHLFSMIDRNGDGEVDREELISWCKLLHLPDSSLASLLTYMSPEQTITLPAFTEALSFHMQPSDLAPHLPPSSPLPSAADLEDAFAALDTRQAPPGCLHLEDLRQALRLALPALDQAKAAAASAPALHRTQRSSSSSRGTTAKAAPPPPPQHPQHLPLQQRVEALLANLPVTSSGMVNYSALVSLLMR